MPVMSAPLLLTPPPCLGGGLGGVERGSAGWLFSAALPRPNLHAMGAPPLSRDKARRLRREETDAERRLWMPAQASNWVCSFAVSIRLVRTSSTSAASNGC